MRSARTAIALLILLTSPVAAETVAGTVVAVHDGDTLTLESRTKVRLFGIDAPELNQQCARNGICEPCGRQARERLAKMVMGKEIACEARGRSYGRIVGSCVVAGQDVDMAMLEAGMAVAYRKYLTRQDSAYGASEDAARTAKVGIWGTVFMPPHEWRRNRARLECERGGP